MSSSYRSVDCIGLWSCLFSSVFQAPLCLRSSWCYIDIEFFLLTSCTLPFSELSLVGLAIVPGWLTIGIQCYDAVGWVMWPVKSSPKWPIMCRVGPKTLLYLSWPLRSTVACPCPGHHLCQFVLKLVNSFSKYSVHRLVVNGQSNVQVENITHPTSLDRLVCT